MGHETDRTSIFRSSLLACKCRRCSVQREFDCPSDVCAGRLRQDAALLHRARLPGRAGACLPVSDAGRSARREVRRDVQVPDARERLAPDGASPRARRAPPQLHGQGDRIRDVLPPACHKARAHRNARRVDIRRRRMELPAPPPRDYGDAHRLARCRERGRIEDDLDRRDGAQAPPQVDDRSFAPPRPRGPEGGERLHEPSAVDRIDDLLGKRVRPLRRRLPDSLPAVDAPRLRPPQELLDEFSDRTAQGGSRAPSLAALEVRRRHLRDDGPLLVEELHDRVALHLRLRPRQFLHGGIRSQKAVRNGARLEPPHHGRQEVLPSARSSSSGATSPRRTCGTRCSRTTTDRISS